MKVTNHKQFFEPCLNMDIFSLFSMFCYNLINRLNNIHNGKAILYRHDIIMMCLSIKTRYFPLLSIMEGIKHVGFIDLYYNLFFANLLSFIIG